MIRGSVSLPVLLVVDMVALLLYNFAGMCVTGAAAARSGALLIQGLAEWPSTYKAATAG